jgi:hypothetical protein
MFSVAAAGVQFKLLTLRGAQEDEMRAVLERQAMEKAALFKKMMGVNKRLKKLVSEKDRLVHSLEVRCWFILYSSIQCMRLLMSGGAATAYRCSLTHLQENAASLIALDQSVHEHFPSVDSPDGGHVELGDDDRERIEECTEKLGTRVKKYLGTLQSDSKSKEKINMMRMMASMMN